jgi:hypothetical protein
MLGQQTAGHRSDREGDWPDPADRLPILPVLRVLWALGDYEHVPQRGRET